MNSKIYGGIFLTLYVALIAVALLYIELEPRPIALEQNDVMYVEFIEPEIPPKPEPIRKEQNPVKPTPPIKKPDPKMQRTSPHEKVAPEEHMEQTGGPAEETKTVNQNALFQMPKVGVDEPVDVGNVAAKQDTVTTASGDNPKSGLSPDGTTEEKLDSGLKGRGCDKLPKPAYPAGNVEGVVVVKVTVRPDGTVETATYERVGSRHDDAAGKVLIPAALAAAKKAHFVKVDGLTVMQGTITYYFKLKK